MLIEVHYGDACVLLVNGQCRSIHLIEYIRTHCHLSTSTRFDLCLISSGEPLHLSESGAKYVSSEFERSHSDTHLHCVLTQVDAEGSYIPLLNDSTLITNEFLNKLRRATGTKGLTKMVPKTGKSSATNAFDEGSKRRRSLKPFIMAASAMNKSS